MKQGKSKLLIACFVMMQKQCLINVLPIIYRTSLCFPPPQNRERTTPSQCMRLSLTWSITPPWCSPTASPPRPCTPPRSPYLPPATTAWPPWGWSPGQPWPWAQVGPERPSIYTDMLKKTLFFFRTKLLKSGFVARNTKLNNVSECVYI